MSDKELDKLFRDKLQEAEFAYNPGNWAAMEEVLDADDKRLTFYWRQAAAILLFGALLSIPLWRSGFSLNSSPDPQPVSTTPAEKSLPSPSTPPSAPPTKTPKETESLQDLINAPESKAESAPMAVAIPERAQSEKAASAPSMSRQTYAALPGLDGRAVVPLSPSEASLALWPWLAAEPLLGEARSPVFSGGHFFLEAGPVLNQSYQGAAGTGWSAGLGWRRPLGRNMALETGLYYNQTGDVGIRSRSDSVFFGFGRTEVSTRKAFRQMGSLRLPLQLSVQLRARHHLQVGAYYDYILRQAMDMEVHTQAFKADLDVEKHHSNERQAEFQPHQYGILLGYRYQMDARLSLGLRLQYGLSDLTSPEYPSLAGHHQLWQSDLYLRYRLF